MVAEKVEAKLIDKISKVIDTGITKAIDRFILFTREKVKIESKKPFQLTEQRLYAYADLQENIKKYNRDIKDLEHESPGRSKSIAFFRANGTGLKQSDDEIQESRIKLVELKIYRDQTEIDEITYAVESVRADKYHEIIQLKYFEGKTDEAIAEALNCDPSTVRRNKNRLIRRIAVKLYGAQAIA